MRSMLVRLLCVLSLRFRVVAFRFIGFSVEDFGV
jgi:hypothetical protein